MVNICLVSKETIKNHVPECLHHFTFLPTVCERSSFSASSPASHIATIFYYSCSYKYVVITHQSINLQTVIASDAKYPFMCSFANIKESVFSLVKCLLMSFAQF